MQPAGGAPGSFSHLSMLFLDFLFTELDLHTQLRVRAVTYLPSPLLVCLFVIEHFS